MWQLTGHTALKILANLEYHVSPRRKRQTVVGNLEFNDGNTSSKNVSSFVPVVSSNNLGTQKACSLLRGSSRNHWPMKLLKLCFGSTVMATKYQCSWLGCFQICLLFCLWGHYLEFYAQTSKACSTLLRCDN